MEKKRLVTRLWKSLDETFPKPVFRWVYHVHPGLEKIGSEIRTSQERRGLCCVFYTVASYTTMVEWSPVRAF